MKNLICGFILFLLLGSCSDRPVYPDAPVKGPDIVIDVSKLKTEIPQYLSYRHRGKHINFFVIRIRDTVHSFLDTCASCYPKKKGFRFEDGYFTCRACNVTYSVSEIEKGIGGCFPIRIAGILRSGGYDISVTDLEAAADKF